MYRLDIFPALFNWLHRMKIPNLFPVFDEWRPAIFGFTCNICNARNRSKSTNLTRENSSCRHCGSTVRMRAIAALLSHELFGMVKPLVEFPFDKSITGIGMSDWDGYAVPLEQRLNYRNTFYHQEPFLDITDVPNEMSNSLDFVLSSDVFEHVLSPVYRAFENTHKLLRPGGVFVFTVPYTLDDSDTLEHFSPLNTFEIYMEDGEYLLRDISSDGKITLYRDLIFHGGPGETLEMRIFSKQSVLKELHNAGFEKIRIVDDNMPHWGIYWNDAWSLPIVARKPLMPPSTEPSKEP